MRSRLSAPSKRTACARSSATGWAPGESTTSLVSRSAVADWRAIRSISRWAAPVSSSAGTTSATRPQASAASASSRRPASSTCLATDSPTSSGSRQQAPAAARMPSPGSGLPKTASGPAIRRSQAYASSAPPPSAQPSTAATVGIGSRRTRSKRRLLTPWSAWSRPRSRSSAMSAPPAKTRPAPVSSRKRGSSSSASQTVCSSRIMRALIAFRASGRSRVTTTRSSRSSTVRVVKAPVRVPVLIRVPPASRRPARRRRRAWPGPGGRPRAPGGPAGSAGCGSPRSPAGGRARWRRRPR